MTSLIKKTRTVYIISSMLFNKSYIGSTCQTLNDRLAKHKIRRSCSSREVIQHGDCMIAPLLIVRDCTRQEIELKEKEFLSQYKDIIVNKNTVQQTKEELKQHQLKQDNKRREKHNLEKRINGRIKTDCDCGGRYTRANKSEHLKTIRHKAFLNLI